MYLYQKGFLTENGYELHLFKTEHSNFIVYAKNIFLFLTTFC